MTLSTQIAVLKKALKNPRLARQEFVRVQAVLFCKLKTSRQTVSATSGKSLSSIENWISLFNKFGIAGLMTRRRKFPPNTKMTKWQLSKLKFLLKRRKKITTHKIDSLLQSRFKTVYHKTSIARLLRRLGLKYSRKNKWR